MEYFYRYVLKSIAPIGAIEYKPTYQHGNAQIMHI